MELYTMISILAILSVHFFQVSKGQLTMDLPDTSTSNATTTVAPAPLLLFTSNILRMCDPMDKLSNSYCNCSEKVVSCDFAKYVSNMTSLKNNTGIDEASSVAKSVTTEHLELELYGHKFPKNASRFCLCNTPPTIHLKLAKDFLPIDITNNFQRFDLFNLSGITHFKGGFSQNFHGDLYIANVSHIPQIEPNEFGRGHGGPLLSVQDIECCSPIKLNQSHEKPVLFIENSTIDLLQTRGINDDHLWKTFVLKSSAINNVQSEGVIFDSYSGYNVAILELTLTNASHESFVIQNASNFILAKSSFKHYKQFEVHSYFFVSRSGLPDSNIVVVDNAFLNQMAFNLEARHTICWYNVFDLWDNYTFSFMKDTGFSHFSSSEAKNRSVSLRHNQIYKVKLPEYSLDFGNDTALTLSDNVLGTCNCTRLMLVEEKAVKSELQWCFTGNKPEKNNCSIRLDVAFKHCNQSESFQFEDLCGNKEVSVPGLPNAGHGHDLLEDTKEMSINSAFMSRIVQDFHYMFTVDSFTKLTDVLSGNDKHNGDSGIHDDEHSASKTDTNGKKGTKSKDKQQAAKKSAVVPVLVTMSVLALIIGGIFIIYRYRHRFFNRTGHHELAESRTEMI